MSNKKKMLFAQESDDDDVEAKCSQQKFQINKNYADSYIKWREKEEYQKLKDRYGDVEGYDGESESETESEDFDPEDLNPEAEKGFFGVLSALKGKDPRIYNNLDVFFNPVVESLNGDNSAKSKSSMKKEKPMFLKDYERKLIVEKEGKLVDEDDEQMDELPYVEQQKKIKQSFKVESDDEVDFLKPREKTEIEKKKEEEDYIEWLKGQKQEISEEDDKKKLKSLHDYWNDPKLDDGEKFLKDYLLNRRYLGNDEDDEKEIVPTYEEIVNDEEDEKQLDVQEEFEHKYNFRFEEPDAEFIKSYPRTIKDSLRRKDETKKTKRELLKDRKEKEKQQRREEIKRLKNLKRKEIFEKLKKLKEVTGDESLPLDPDEFEKDFDPADYDRKMKDVFNDNFYAKGDDDEEKPTFTPSDSDATDEEALDKLDPFNEDEEESQQPSTSKGITKKKFVEVIKRKKPVFDPDEKSFEQYFDEYYKLDCEDIIGGDLMCRFKYRKVAPNDFGLTTEEILKAKPKELNAWVSIRKMSQYRSEQDEKYDISAYQKKAQDFCKKKRILATVYKEANKKEENADANDVGDIDNGTSSAVGTSKKFDLQKKIPSKKRTMEDVVQDLPDERLKAYGINPKKLKNKMKYKKKV